jgi:glutathione S-transferase
VFAPSQKVRSTTARRPRSEHPRQSLDRAEWRLGDVKRIEINEAFAAIVIAVKRELGLSRDIVIRTPKERFDPEAQKRDAARCARVLELLDERLADRQFVGGDAFSMADIPVGASVYRWYALDIVQPSPQSASVVQQAQRTACIPKRK